MKIVVLVGDGMGDYPLEALGGRTVLQAARMPHVRRIAAAGEVRLVETVPAGMAPGSDVANLSLLGYDPAVNYSGRAPIEAAGAGIGLGPDDTAYRCNLVTVRDGRMEDYSAGHITTGEAAGLIGAVQERLGGGGLRFHAGVSYRHLLVWEHGPVEVVTQPPHDIAGRPVGDYLPEGDRAERLRGLMEASREILAAHPVNRARRGKGLREATQVWLWGQGRRMALTPYPVQYGLAGGVVSAVDLVRGLGRLAGLSAPVVPGATGFLDTNCEGKVAALEALLEEGDFAFLHLEAPDECGHLGDAAKKVLACEMFDARIVGPVWEGLERRGEPYVLVIATDHRTPCPVRGHTREPVPMARLRGPVGPVTDKAPFDEFVAGGRSGGMAFDWIRETLKAASPAAPGRRSGRAGPTAAGR